MNFGVGRFWKLGIFLVKLCTCISKRWENRPSVFPGALPPQLSPLAQSALQLATWESGKEERTVLRVFTCQREQGWKDEGSEAGAGSAGCKGCLCPGATRVGATMILKITLISLSGDESQTHAQVYLSPQLVLRTFLARLLNLINLFLWWKDFL